MPRHFPRLTLVSLLLSAVAVLAGGLWLARQIDFERVERDRAPLMAFANALQGEIDRLEALYQSHVRTLAADAPLGDGFALQAQAGRLVGVRQVSILSDAGPDGEHIKIGKDAGVLLRPVLQGNRSSLLRDPVILPTANALPGQGGWVSAVGQGKFFWYRRDRAAVVAVLVDSDAVRGTIRESLQAWSEEAFRPVRALGGPDALREAELKSLVATGELPKRFPDLILPMRSDFGEWEVVSWHQERRQVIWSWPILAGATSLSAALVWLAVAGFVWQRRLQRLAAQRVSFVNRVSHELRTPLTNIVLNADLAAEAIESAPREAARRLEVMREEAGRLNRLIDNVLAFSKRDSRQPAARESLIRPEEVVKRVVRAFEPAFTRKGMTLRVVGTLPPARTDADSLTQVLANLLSNAEKYVSSGVVEISLRREAAELVVRVRDEGEGVSMNDAERIFQPFVRLNDRLTEGVGGAGLGLSIAREAALRLGGSLSLMNDPGGGPPGRGACFELRIPAYRESGSEPEQVEDHPLDSATHPRMTAPTLPVSP